MGNFDSSKVTAAIVNQVSKEHQLIQAQISRNQASRETTGYAQGRTLSQPISIPQVNMSMSNEQRKYHAPNSTTDVGGARDNDDVESFKVINNQPLTVQVPLKVGPTKNIY